MKKELDAQERLFGGDARIIRKTITLFVLVGLSTFLIAIGAIYSGKLLDHHFGTTPWLMVAFGIIGVSLAMTLTLLFTMRSLRSIQSLLHKDSGKDIT